MAIVINATKEDQSIKLAGNWFTFKPGQKKVMNDSIAQFIQTDRKESGLAVLPKEFEEDADYAASPEGKKILEQLCDRAVEEYIAFHREVIRNNQISLRRDLEQANIKADPAVFASEGEINSMRIVAKYQRAARDDAQKRIDEVKSLVKELETK